MQRIKVVKQKIEKIFFRRAYTLAEVLMTLSVIGVVAVLTISTFSKQYFDKVDVVKVKQVYSILDNAIKMALVENGPFDSWDWPSNKQYDGNNSKYLGDVLKNYLKLHKYCGSSYDCFSDLNKTLYWKNLNNGMASGNGTVQSNYGKMILQNGMRLYVGSNTIDGSYNGEVGSIVVDINGKKGPNRIGYDVFSFSIVSNGLSYKKYVGWWIKTNSLYCKKGSGLSEFQDGIACSYWVMHKGNMDYKYRDVTKEWP